MHICIISPGHLSTNPRLVKEATTLKQAGYRISIVCGKYSRPWSEADERIRPSFDDVHPVRFGRSEASKQTYLRQAIVHRLARITGARFSFPWAMENGHAPVVSDLMRATQQVRADLYIAHYIAALPAAAKAATRYNAIFAFDAEDFHLGDRPDTPENQLDNKFVESIERRYLPRAAYVTAASPLMADAYAAKYNIPRPVVVLNAFPKGGAPSSPSEQGTAAPSPSLYWFSQTIGPGRGVETAIEAISMSRLGVHLFVRGLGNPDYLASLRRLAHKVGVQERLHFLPLAAPDEMEILGAEFDAGYIGELNLTANRQIALTNKTFSYLTSGLAIVASDIPSHRQISDELGEAITLFKMGDSVDLAHSLDALLGDGPRLTAARRRAWELGQGVFSWEVQQERLLQVVRSVIG